MEPKKNDTFPFGELAVFNKCLAVSIHASAKQQKQVPCRFPQRLHFNTAGHRDPEAMKPNSDSQRDTVEWLQK